MSTHTRIILASTAALMIGAGVTAEVVLRSTASDALTGYLESTSIDATLSPTPVLVQALTGRIDATLAVDETALAALVGCTTDLPEPEVRIGDAGVTISLVREVAGLSLPIEILIIPTLIDDRWVLTPDSIAVGGIAIPADRAAALIGDDAQSSMLSEGIPLPHTDALSVTGVSTRAGLVTLDVSLAFPPTSDSAARAGSAPAGPAAGSLDCLTAPDSHGETS